MKIPRFLVFLALAALLGGGCLEQEPSSESTLHAFDRSDSVPSAQATGMPSTFTIDRIMEDSLFTDKNAVSAASIQEFLLNTPYGTTSSLAFLKDNLGRPVSQMIYDAATLWNLNPILLLARLQVESSMISRSSAVKLSDLDYSLGCGCPDYRSSCMSAYKGFHAQLVCAAVVLRESFESSQRADGIWIAGKTKKSLDQIAITPHNHATAALYAYTPWVLRGEGGNWLVWNITRKYISYLNALGRWHYIAPGWIGSSCAEEPSPVCAFTHLDKIGYCHISHAGAPGFCSLPCAGYCQDLGNVTTFCVDLGSGSGSCVAKATSANEDCAAIPGTIPEERERFTGDSKALPTSARVCAPLYPAD